MVRKIGLKMRIDNFLDALFARRTSMLYERPQSHEHVVRHGAWRWIDNDTFGTNEIPNIICFYQLWCAHQTTEATSINFDFVVHQRWRKLPRKDDEDAVGSSTRTKKKKKKKTNKMHLINVYASRQKFVLISFLIISRGPRPTFAWTLNRLQ